MDECGLDLSSIYLRPKKDPHVRIGQSYQVNLPEEDLQEKTKNIQQNIIKVTEEKINYKIENKTKEDLESFKPNKKRRIDNNI